MKNLNTFCIFAVPQSLTVKLWYVQQIPSRAVKTYLSTAVYTAKLKAVQT